MQSELQAILSFLLLDQKLPVAATVGSEVQTRDSVGHPPKKKWQGDTQGNLLLNSLLNITPPKPPGVFVGYSEHTGSKRLGAMPRSSSNCSEPNLEAQCAPYRQLLQMPPRSIQRYAYKCKNDTEGLESNPFGGVHEFGRQWHVGRFGPTGHGLKHVYQPHVGREKNEKDLEVERDR